MVICPLRATNFPGGGGGIKKKSNLYRTYACWPNSLVHMHSHTEIGHKNYMQDQLSKYTNLFNIASSYNKCKNPLHRIIE